MPGIEDVEIKLQEIENIEAGHRLNYIQDLIDVRHWLEANKASVPHELSRLNDWGQRYEHLARPLADSLQKEVAARINIYQNGWVPTDLDQFQDELKLVQAAMSQISDLLPARSTQPEFLALQEQFSSLLSRVTRNRQLDRLEKELQGLWKRAEALDKGSPDRAMGLCWDALNLVLDEKSKGGWEAEEIDKLFILEHEARNRYDDMRRRHAIPTTKTAGEELVEVVIQFTTLVKENPEKPVTYFESAKEQASKSMAVAEALEIARDRLLLFWGEKIEKYIEQAKAELKVHKPRAAMTALALWRVLPGLNDKRVDLRIRPDDTIRIKDVEELTKPELEALQKAELWAVRAEQERDPLKAYEHWQKARDAYAYWPNLGQLRESILKTANQKIEDLLKKAEKSLKEEQWGLGKTRLDEATKLLQLDPTLLDEFQPYYDDLCSVYENVEPLSRRGKTQPNSQEEKVILETLEAKYRDSYWSDWPRLNNRLAELRARSSVHAFEEEATKLCRTDGALAALEVLYRDAQNMLAAPPKALSREDFGKLEKIMVRLEAWRGYAWARDEVDKVSRLGDETANLPDLALARQGLEAARKEVETAQAIKSLEEKLNHFSSKDARAKEALTEGQNLLKSDSRVALRQAEKWLKEITSYRTGFLEIKRTAQQQLADQIEQEINIQVTRVKNDRFTSLDIDRLEALLNEVEKLMGDYVEAERVELWRSLTAGPLAMAKAHRRQQQMEQSHTTWEKVKSEWETAAQVITDEDLQAYCVRRAKLAHKQSEFLRAKRQTNQAEGILKNLCEDLMLQADWEVWYEHGRVCLEHAQALIGRTYTEEANRQEAAMLATARESLNNARLLSTADSTGAGQQITPVDPLLDTLDKWEQLVRRERDILVTLQKAQSHLTAATCREVTKKFIEGKGALPGDEFRSLFEEFWNAQLTDVRARLDSQLEQTPDLTNRVDILIAMRFLWPEDKTIEMGLVQQLGQAVGDIRRMVDEVVDDASAQKFRQQYEQQHRRLALKDKEQDIARLQLEEARQLSDQVQNIKLVRDIAISQLNDLGYSVAALDKDEDELKGWIEQLEKLLNTTGEALQLAEAGLRRNERFETAKYILRLGSQSSANVEQVPQMFRDKGHATYSWCVEQVRQLEARRQKQADLKVKIDGCLKYAHISKPDEFPVRFDNSAESALVAELRQKLQLQSTLSYPIEEAIKLMQEMSRQEPEDACGLQGSMRYLDPDDGNRLYESLQSIQTMLQQKVAQIHVLGRWLEQFTGGVVAEWSQAKKEIERLRDSGPEGLGQARNLCQKVRVGDSQGFYCSNHWSLRKAEQSLSDQAMKGHLREKMGLADQEQVILCAVARQIAQGRETLQQQFKMQIQECQSLEADIGRRIKDFNACWNDFRNAYRDLITKKPGLDLRKMTRRNYSNTNEWARLQEATRRFCTICPNYTEFQDALRQVEAETGIELSCSGL